MVEISHKPQVLNLQTACFENAPSSSIYSQLENGEFYLRSQPIVKLSETHVFPQRHEILLGIGNNLLTHSAEDFFQLVEKTDKTKIIDQWVMDQIIKLVRFNSQRLAAIDRLNINLSASTLNSTAHLLRIHNRLLSGELPGRKICFEITESGAIQDLDRVADFMHAAKQHSCLFALDDFGSGYCSFEYLNKLPVDSIKIDGSLISNLSESKSAKVIVSAIANIANELNMSTVAEWVESPEILKIVRDIGITYGQGKLFGMPTPFTTVKGENHGDFHASRNVS